MSDSPSADANRMKSKKRRGKREKSTSATSDEQGEFTLPLTLVPCSTTRNSSYSFTKKILFWGIEDLDRNVPFSMAYSNRNISCFAVNIPIDQQEHRDEINDRSYFNHNCLHSHINKIGIKETTLTPLFTFPKNSNSHVPPFFNTFATIESFVFSIGGIYGEDNKMQKDSKISGSNLVYYFDTRYEYDHNRSWKQAPSMITYRQNPQAITVNRKIFVFGCFGGFKCPHNPVCCVWAEVFDSSSREWSSISVPKFNHSLVVCSPNNMKMTCVAEKISALVDDSVYQLDVETKNWNYIAKFENVFEEAVKQPVLVRNILYWFDHNTHAYDIVKGETFEGPVQDISFQRVMRRVQSKGKHADSNSEPAILHLGGRYFCLLAYLPDLEEDNPKRIHCLIIKVSKTNESYVQQCTRWDVSEFFLAARVISCQSFSIDRRLKLLDGLIMMI